MAKDNHDDLLLYGGLAFAAIIGVKALLKSIGIDPENTAKVQAIDQLSPDQNPFTHNWKTNTCGSETSFGGYDVDQWRSLKDSVDNEDNETLYAANWVKSVELLHSAFGGITDIFNGHNFSDVMTAFHGFNSKKDVADADSFLQANYGIALWPLLKSGYPYLFLPINNGLNDNDLAQVIDYVNTLPDCPNGSTLGVSSGSW